MKKKHLIPAALALAAVLPAALDSRLQTVRYEVASEKLSGPVRLALLTDLHSCRYGEGQAELIAAVDRAAPDVLLFGGDICDDALPAEPVRTLLAAVAQKYPCYYVTGNHECRDGRANEFCELFRACGATVLHGTRAAVTVRGQTFDLCGIDNTDESHLGSRGFFGRWQLENLKKTQDPGRYSILLAHHPEHIAVYLEYGFDLVLSGHAHGGQWRIPGILNGVFAPGQGLFPPYAGGKYDFGPRSLIVSRGLARESTRIPRIFNRPELVIVELHGTQP